MEKVTGWVCEFIYVAFLFIIFHIYRSDVAEASFSLLASCLDVDASDHHYICGVWADHVS